jgi:hypothetical protein
MIFEVERASILSVSGFLVSVMRRGFVSYRFMGKMLAREGWAGEAFYEPGRAGEELYSLGT